MRKHRRIIKRRKANPREFIAMWFHSTKEWIVVTDFGRRLASSSCIFEAVGNALKCIGAVVEDYHCHATHDFRRYTKENKR